MSFNVRIFTEEEKKAYWAKQKANARKDREIGDTITYHPAREERIFHREKALFWPRKRSFRPAYVETKLHDPSLTAMIKTHESNLQSYQRWLKAVVREFQNCKREGEEGRGLSKMEFMRVSNQATVWTHNGWPRQLSPKEYFKILQALPGEITYEEDEVLL